jgi:hypothetical protein
MDFIRSVNPRTEDEFASLLIEWELCHLNFARRVADGQLFVTHCTVVPQVHVPGHRLDVINTETQQMTVRIQYSCESLCTKTLHLCLVAAH